MQKARRHHCWLRPLVGVRFQVLFHPVIHGTFHLSFTVLVHYRSLGSIQPYQMVLANSNRASPTRPYSGYHQISILYAYGTLTLYRPVSHPVPLHIPLIMWSYNPQIAVTNQVWALARSLATTCAITKLFSLPSGTQMFQFPEFAPIARQCIFNALGCPIRKSTDQFLFANPRSLSQLITSFLASESLGIPHTPLFTSFNDSFQ